MLSIPIQEQATLLTEGKQQISKKLKGEKLKPQPVLWRVPLASIVLLKRNERKHILQPEPQEQSLNIKQILKKMV